MSQDSTITKQLNLIQMSNETKLLSQICSFQRVVAERLCSDKEFYQESTAPH